MRRARAKIAAPTPIPACAAVERPEVCGCEVVDAVADEAAEDVL